MGIFGRKKETMETVSPRVETWIVECGPTCGFMVRDHDKKELAAMVMQHMKQTHKTTMSEAEALKDAKAVAAMPA